jgi:F0F1-type ATP synthase assembly protein I
MEKTNRLKIGHRKDQISEIAFIMFTLASIAICLVLAAYMYNMIGSEISSTDIATNESTAAYQKFDTAWSILDGGMVLVVIGLTLGLIVTSFLIPTHPVFFIINIIGFIVLVFIGAVYSNTFSDIVEADQDMYNTTTTYFSYTGWMMSNMPYIAAALVFVASIVMYGKGKSEGF